MKKPKLQLVEIQTDGPVATVRINNPPVNALSRAVRGELRFVFEKLAQENTTQRIYLEGNGKHFCGGADITEIQQIVEMNDPKERRRSALAFSLDGQHLMQQIMRLGQSKPITAHIRGACMGGGLELALACNYRILIDDATLGFPEVTLGLLPGWGGTVLVPHLLSESFTKRKWLADMLPGATLQETTFATSLRWLSSGSFLAPAELWQYHIVHSMTPSEPARLVPPRRNPSPHAKQLIERALHQMPWTETGYECTNDLFGTERHLFAQALAHPDALEGITAFLEKRDPVFLEE